METLNKLIIVFNEIGYNSIDNYFYNLDEVFTLKELLDSYIDKYDNTLIDIFDLILEYLKQQTNDVKFDLINDT